MKNKKMITIILVIMIMLLCTSCDKNKEKKTPVRIAYFPNITHSQALVMKDQKSLDDKLGDGYEVTWTAFNAGPSEVEAIFAGEIDLGYIGPVPAINANVKSDGDVKIIANACDAGAVLIKSKDSEIKTVADLQGKTVAVPQLGNTQHLCLLNLLNENGLETKDNGGTVQVVAVENSDLQGMLESGEVDAAIVPEPWGSILEENIGAQLVLDYDEIFLSGAYPSTVVIVNGDFYEEHRDIVESFLEEHKATTLYINEHNDEALSIINKQIKEATGKTIDTDIIAKSFERLKITEKLSMDAIMKFSDIGIEQGFISEKPSNDIMDTEILDGIK